MKRRTTLVDGRPELEAVATGAAGRIREAIAGLPWQVAFEVAWSLAGDRSTVLSTIGLGLLERWSDRELGNDLCAEVWFGDAAAVAGRLSGEPPWGTIRAELEAVVEAWRREHPTWRVGGRRPAAGPTP